MTKEDITTKNYHDVKNVKKGADTTAINSVILAHFWYFHTLEKSLLNMLILCSVSASELKKLFVL